MLDLVVTGGFSEYEIENGLDVFLAAFGKNIPILIMTGDSPSLIAKMYKREKEGELDSGMIVQIEKGIITKPIKIAEFKKRISDLLKKA